MLPTPPLCCCRTNIQSAQKVANVGKKRESSWYSNFIFSIFVSLLAKLMELQSRLGDFSRFFAGTRHTLSTLLRATLYCLLCRTTWKPTVISSLQWYIYIPPALTFPTLQHILPASYINVLRILIPMSIISLNRMNWFVFVIKMQCLSVRYVMHLYVLNRIFLGRESCEVAKVLKCCRDFLRPNLQVSPENGDGACPWNFEEYPHLKTAVWLRRFYWFFFSPWKASRLFLK